MITSISHYRYIVWQFSNLNSPVAQLAFAVCFHGGGKSQVTIRDVLQEYDGEAQISGNSINGQKLDCTLMSLQTSSKTNLSRA